MREPSRVVRDGYDAMAERHLRWLGKIEGDPRLRFLAELEARLPAGSVVVDLGCGAGVPCTAALAERHSVLGVDISFKQLTLAAAGVPGGRFVQQDIAAMELVDGSVDAVTAFYSLTHVPRNEHGLLLSQIARWLRPGGLLLATFSAGGTSDGVQENFLGVPMYFSGWDADTNRRLVTRAGLLLVLDETVTMREPEGPSTFLWLLASKPD